MLLKRITQAVYLLLAHSFEIFILAVRIMPLLKPSQITLWLYQCEWNGFPVFSLKRGDNLGMSAAGCGICEGVLLLSKDEQSVSKASEKPDVQQKQQQEQIDPRGAPDTRDTTHIAPRCRPAGEQLLLCALTLCTWQPWSHNLKSTIWS